MRPLTPREKRTVRFGGLVVAAYLLIFGGVHAWNFCARKHAEYHQLVREAQNLKREIQLYQDKAQKAQSLINDYRLDPLKLTRVTAVAEASSAIQKAAAGGGLAVGPVRESPGLGSNKELATMQLECSGPVPAITAFFRRLQTVGYPLLVETVQISPSANPPGQLKLSLTLVILDFDQWKPEAIPHA
ncbi:MAG TPA: hypothetical protein VN578_25235 [Candidatus Binatia bacterium]|jgi:hypothetical protein|nr:hypothetical protein [Candidatus Binatia bacterium]